MSNEINKIKGPPKPMDPASEMKQGKPEGPFVARCPLTIGKGRAGGGNARVLQPGDVLRGSIATALADEDRERYPKHGSKLVKLIALDALWDTKAGKVPFPDQPVWGVRKDGSPRIVAPSIGCQPGMCVARAPGVHAKGEIVPIESQSPAKDRRDVKLSA